MNAITFEQERVVQFWTHVELGIISLRKNFPDGLISSHLPKIRKWCNDHQSEMRYCSFGAHFLFEDPRDAVLFALRWA